MKPEIKSATKAVIGGLIVSTILLCAETNSHDTGICVKYGIAAIVCALAAVALMGWVYLKEEEERRPKL